MITPILRFGLISLEIDGMVHVYLYKEKIIDAV